MTLSKPVISNRGREVSFSGAGRANQHKPPLRLLGEAVCLLKRYLLWVLRQVLDVRIEGLVGKCLQVRPLEEPVQATIGNLALLARTGND